MQEIERRISTQAEHLRTVCKMNIFLCLLLGVSVNSLCSIVYWLWLQQSNLFKAREEKYQSRIKVLEALATGTNEESQV